VNSLIRFSTLFLFLTVVTFSTKAQIHDISALPETDALLYLDVNRCLNEVAPAILKKYPAQLARFNKELDSVKQKAGFDPRSVKKIFVGFRATSLDPKDMKGDFLLVATGTFNANTLMSFGRLASGGKFTESEQSGRKIYTFKIDGELKQKAAASRVDEISATAFDENTLVVGTPSYVRDACDTTADKKRISSELITLLSQDQNALFSVAATMPLKLKDYMKDSKQEIFSSVASSIRNFYFSVGYDQRALSLSAVLGTSSNEYAVLLKDLISTGLQYASSSGDKSVQETLKSLTLETRGPQVWIGAAIKSRVTYTEEKTSTKIEI
jgi:hypothetical protein